MNPKHIGTDFDEFLKEEGIMTDNITRLYELAGVEIPKSLASMCWAKEVLFTAEKQLELIKWLSDTFVFRTYTRLKKEVTCLLTEREYGCDEYYCKSASFDQALTGLIIELWNDLTDEQKAEIKRILE